MNQTLRWHQFHGTRASPLRKVSFCSKFQISLCLNQRYHNQLITLTCKLCILIIYQMAGKLRVGYYLDDGIFPPTPGVVRVVLNLSFVSRIGLEYNCVSTSIEVCSISLILLSRIGQEWYIWFGLQVRAVQEVVDKLKEDGHHVRFPFWFHIIFPFNFHMIFPLYQRGRPSCEISNIKISCRSARDLWGFS